MREGESVALGIRIYEESTAPAAHARGRLVKTMAQVNDAITGLRRKLHHAQFFVFCTHRSQQLAKLNLPSDAVYVTCEDGYTGSLETLWLLAQCRHHVFTNSSYYWWGAWLSAAVYGGVSGGQLIYAADNFINRDGLCAEWTKF